MTFRYCLDKIQSSFPGCLWIWSLTDLDSALFCSPLSAHFRHPGRLLVPAAHPRSLISLPLQMPVLLLGTVFSPPPPCLVQLFPVMWSQKNLPRLQGLGTLPMRCAVFTSPPSVFFHHVWHHLLDLGTLIYKHHRGRGFSPVSSATSKEDLRKYLMNEPLL